MKAQNTKLRALTVLGTVVWLPGAAQVSQQAGSAGLGLWGPGSLQQTPAWSTSSSSSCLPLSVQDLTLELFDLSLRRPHSTDPLRPPSPVPAQLAGALSGSSLHRLHTTLLKGFLGTDLSQISQRPGGKKLKLICVLILLQMAARDESSRSPGDAAQLSQSRAGRAAGNGSEPA